MTASRWQHLRPQSLEHACALLSEQGAVPIAGGTELFLRMKQGLEQPRYLVDLADLPGMSEISREADGTLHFGAAVSLTAIERSPLVAADLPALGQAARRVGAPQLRNMGSLGGNLCQQTMCWWYNQASLWREAKDACYKAGGELCHVVDKPKVCYAVYRSDVATVLVGLEAVLTVHGPQGQRRMPIEELYSGDAAFPFTLAQGELVTAVQVRPLGEQGFASFYKTAHRKAIDYPLVSLALVARANGNDGQPRVRIVLGALEGLPLRVDKAEELLQHEGTNEAAIEAAAALVAKRAKPVKNISFGAPDYRRRMTAVLARRALHELRDWTNRHS